MNVDVDVDVDVLMNLITWFLCVDVDVGMDVGYWGPGSV